MRIVLWEVKKTLAKESRKRGVKVRTRNGIISESDQLNRITTSEFEIENNMKKSVESSLKNRRRTWSRRFYNG